MANQLPTDGRVQSVITVRMPPEVHAALVAKAHDARTSMNLYVLGLISRDLAAVARTNLQREA